MKHSVTHLRPTVSPSDMNYGDIAIVENTYGGFLAGYHILRHQMGWVVLEDPTICHSNACVWSFDLKVHIMPVGCRLELIIGGDQ